MGYPESIGSGRYLPDMLLSGYVENFCSLFRIPFTHLKCESRFSDTRFSGKKYETSLRETAAEDTIELVTRTGKSSIDECFGGSNFLDILCLS